MKISLTRAFKERSRLNRKISETLALISSENSMAESSVRSIDVKQKYEEFHALCEKLLALKQTISRANAGISDKLVELSELKTLLTHLKSIPCSEETQNTYTSEVKFVAVIKKPQLLEEMAALQARIDACQDTIDEFNARTRIEFEL